MAREKSGSVFEREKGIWYARMTFTDESGKRRYVKRRAENRSHARDLVKQLLREYEDYGEQALDGAQMNFNELADYYAKRYLIPAQYVEDRKVAGLRSHRDGLLF